jgi:hypothetical protein
VVLRFQGLYWLSLAIRNGDLGVGEYLTRVDYFIVFDFLRHDLKLLERLHIIGFLERVELPVIGLPFCEEPGVCLEHELALEDPLTVDEAHVAELKVLELADRAAENLNLLCHLEDAEASGNREQLLVSTAFLALAVGEPGHAICDLTEPGSLFGPLDAVHVSQSVEGEVEADRDFVRCGVNFLDDELEMKLHETLARALIRYEVVFYHFHVESVKFAAGPLDCSHSLAFLLLLKLLFNEGSKRKVLKEESFILIKCLGFDCWCLLRGLARFQH